MAYREKGVDGQKSIVFVGQSMYPLLHDLDILFIAPCSARELKKGDVIVFNSKRDGRDIIVVHRIIFAGKGHFRTKGDNNPYADEHPVPIQSVIGRAIYARRGSRIIRVHGGNRGKAYAFAACVRSRIKAAILRLLAPPYRLLSRSGFFRKLLSRSMTRRIVYFQRPDGMESQLLWGGLIIGKRKAGDDRWSIMPPFKLFVDEASLPAGPDRSIK